MRDRTICSTKFCTAAEEARSVTEYYQDIAGKGKTGGRGGGGWGGGPEMLFCQRSGHLGIGAVHSRRERVCAVGHSGILLFKATRGRQCCAGAQTPSEDSSLHSHLAAAAPLLQPDRRRKLNSQTVLIKLMQSARQPDCAPNHVPCSTLPQPRVLPPRPRPLDLPDGPPLPTSAG